MLELLGGYADDNATADAADESRAETEGDGASRAGTVAKCWRRDAVIDSIVGRSVVSSLGVIR